MQVDVNNFENFSLLEYSDNLELLKINSHSDLVGEKVFYVKPSYGVHIVEKWDANRAEYLLNIDGQKFWSNPFCIFRIPN